MRGMEIVSILGVAFLFIGMLAFSVLLIWTIINAIRKRRFKPQLIGAICSILVAIVGVVILYNVGSNAIEAERIASSESKETDQSFSESESIEESENAAGQFISESESEGESTSVENMTEEEKVIEAIEDKNPSIEVIELNGQFDFEPYTMAITLNGDDNLTLNMIREGFMMDIFETLKAMENIDYSKFDNIGINVKYDDEFMIKSRFDADAIEAIGEKEKTYKDLEELSSDWWISPRITEE